MKKILKIYIMPPLEHNFWHFCKIEMLYRQTLLTQILHAAGVTLLRLCFTPRRLRSLRICMI